MVPTIYLGYISIHFWELIALPFYLLIIYFIARHIKRKRISSNPCYKYYVTGLFAKIAGGIIFVIVYIYFYNGGDTTAYFESAMAMNNLLAVSPGSWLQNEFGAASPEHYSLFSMDTGYPLDYMYGDHKTYMVIRMINPLLILTFKSYLLTTVLVSWLAYSGIWRLFLVFSEHYPNRKKWFALGILFFPSVIFWGSGILKDTITLCCTGWVMYCIYMVFILKKSRLKFFIILLINMYFIVVIKPYIILALFPGTTFWILSNRVAGIKNTLVRTSIVPLFFVASCAGGYIFITLLGDYMGKFALNKIVTTAIVTQNDLRRDYYHGSSFDIGTMEPTAAGFIKKVPAALTAGIYRPFLWESKNIVMLVSGLENTLILLLTLISIFRTNPFAFFRKLLKEPILFFSLTFAIFFAFSVGLTTSNFGALVRFKIAYLPFFLCALFILIKRKDEVVERELREERFAITSKSLRMNRLSET